MGIQPIEAATLLPDNHQGPALETVLTRLVPKRVIRRVLFVVPPDGDAKNFAYTTCKLGRYPNFPPYGVGVLAANLRRDGLQVDVLNLNNLILKSCRASGSEGAFDFEGVVTQALTKSLNAFQPDLIGITCMFSQTHSSMVQVAQQIKSLRPGTPLAMGGVHVTNSLIEDETREIFLGDLPHVDLFFLYEADLAFTRFVSVVNQKLPMTELAQVMIQEGGHVWHITDRQLPSGEELNVIPAHDLITEPDLGDNGKIGSYHCFPKPGTRYSTTLSNRGCRAQCTFCSVRNFNGPTVRGRSVQSVIDELLMLRQDYGVGHIMWLDDDFLKDHGRALKLFNEMVRQDVGLTWDCTNGVIAFSCTEELMSGAAESGCLGLNIGMESGNPEILRRIKKPGTVETFLKAAKVLRQCEQINARVFLMLGFPHETLRMVQDTFEVAREMDLDWCTITPLQPLPNTPIFREMALEGMVGAVTFDEIRFKLGAHGKQRKATERRINVFATDFKHAFDGHKPDHIPTKQEINQLWAYMNYHLNFERLFREKRPVKHIQMHQYLGYIADVVAPDDAFAVYFKEYLHWKAYGRGNPDQVDRLRGLITETPEWGERFHDYHLSVENLVTGCFPEEELVEV